MPAPPALVHITLDPPYRIVADARAVVFSGWAEVNDTAAPDIRMWLNGIETPVELFDRPGIQKQFPGLPAWGLRAIVDLYDLVAALKAGEVSEPFLVMVTIHSDNRVRTFEYAVTDDWLQALFRRPVRARRIPPEELQIRVAGAAAGEFHRTGRRVAEQIAAILQANGHPLTEHRRILDFGAGPGRVTDCIHDMHPAAKLSGSDIDPEAIAWAQTALGDIADFRVNGAEPPLPFDDEAFDLIYGISVFTHLPEDLQHAWLADLRRVLKPGGLLLTTKLNPAAYDLPTEVKQAGVEQGFAYWGEAAATDGLPGFYRLAYHTEDYVRRAWGRYFEVVHVGSHDINGSQDAVLLRRPRHALSWLPRSLRHGLHGLIRGRR